MGKERDTLRPGVAAVIVMERVVVAIGMATARVMEMVVAMEMGTATQKAAAGMLTVIVMGRTGMEEVEADTGRTEVQMMVGMVKAGKKVVTVRAEWTQRWTPPRWTRWTARQIRQLMVLPCPSHPNARKVDGTVRWYVKCEIVFNFEKDLITRCLRAGLGPKV